MRKLHLAVLLFCFGLFQQISHAQTSQIAQAIADQKREMLGRWREFSPSSNLVQFDEDGSVKLYLKKGEIGDLHELKGEWKITEPYRIYVRFQVNGKDIASSVSALRIDGDEMVMTDMSNHEETKHRRHTGGLPKEFDW